MCERNLGIRISGVELPSWTHRVNTPLKPIRPLVWLIGMRNVGKTELGRAAARHLQYDFIDLDETIGLDVEEFVKTHGWEKFREVCEGS